MDGTPFPVQRSLLSAPALARKLAREYALPDDLQCRFWSRSINDTYLVEAGRAKYILRVSPANRRSRESLNAEVDLLRFLHRRKFSAGQPVRRTDGTYVTSLNAPEGQRYAILFAFVPGTPLEAEQSFAYGRMVARLHHITNENPTVEDGLRFDAIHLIDAPLRLLEPHFVGRPQDFKYLTEVAEDLKQAAAGLPCTAPEYGLCHGDVNGGNILFKQGDCPTLIDFEYFGTGWRVFDIATFINNQVCNLDRSARSKQMRADFLAGYQSQRALSEAELTALPAFVMLRQLWILGVGVTNLPHIGLAMWRDWVFEQCLPTIKAWMNEPW